MTWNININLERLECLYIHTYGILDWIDFIDCLSSAHTQTQIRTRTCTHTHTRARAHTHTPVRQHIWEGEMTWLVTWVVNSCYAEADHACSYHLQYHHHHQFVVMECQTSLCYYGDHPPMPWGKPWTPRYHHCASLSQPVQRVWDWLIENEIHWAVDVVRCRPFCALLSPVVIS